MKILLDLYHRSSSSSDSSSSSSYTPSTPSRSSGPDAEAKMNSEADGYYIAKNYDKAISLYDKIIDSNSRFKNYARGQRGKCYYFMGNIDQAFNDITQALDGGLTGLVRTEAFYFRGFIYKIRNETSEAVSDLKQAAELGYPPASSSSSSSYDEYSEGHPTLFGIIGAVVLGGIGYSLGKFIGLAIGGLAGWFIGKAIGSKISFGGGSSSHVGIGSKLLGVLFGIIGAVVLLAIALILMTKLDTAGMVNLLGLLGSPVVGFILGYKISRSLAGKLIILAALIGAGILFVWFNWTALAPYFGKAQTVSETAATVNANVNFRKEPTTGDNIIRQLQQGDTVTLTGEANGSWTQILHNGDTGWISTEYLKK